jgi:hypothetical protein
MSNDTEELVVAAEAPAEQSEPKISPIEEKARAAGWRPKDEFSGDPEDFVGAGEFLRRGELFDAISSRGKEIKELKSTIDSLAKHFKEEKARAYQEALEKLRAERDTAIELGDKGRVYQIEQKIAMTKQTDDIQVSEPTIDEQKEVAAFLDRNKLWFNAATAENAALRAEAIAFEEGLAKAEPTLNVVERLTRVEDHMKRKLNVGTAKSPVAVSDPTSKPTTSKSKVTFDQLSGIQKKICNQLIDQGVFKSPQEYIDALIKQEKR